MVQSKILFLHLDSLVCNKTLKCKKLWYNIFGGRLTIPNTFWHSEKTLQKTGGKIC
jgi:hypothetical protein